MKFLDVHCPPWMDDADFFQIAVNYDPSVTPLINQPAFPKSLVVHRRQLAWAAIISGRHLSLEPDALSSRKNQFNQWRATSALGFLNYDSDWFLSKDMVLNGLESTEKGQIGFAIGSLCATVACFLHFNAIALVHVNTMERHHPGWIDFDPAQSRRPDYVAVTRDYSCLVVEAKGRSEGASRLTPEFLNKNGNGNAPMAQAAAIRRINLYPGGSNNPLHIKNSIPMALLGIATEYGGSRLTVVAADPPPGITIRVSPAQILEVYYQELAAAMEELNDDDTALPAAGIVRLEFPDDLEEFQESLRVESYVGAPFWRELDPRLREALTDTPSEQLDLYAMMQRFYTASILQSAGKEIDEGGDPIWALEHFRLDFYEMMLDARVQHAIATAEALWGQHAQALVSSLINRACFVRQPDGTIIQGWAR